MTTLEARPTDGDSNSRRYRGDIRNRGWGSALRSSAPGRQQERGAADPGGLSVDRRSGRARQRAPDPRRRGDDRAAGRHRRRRGVGGRPTALRMWAADISVDPPRPRTVHAHPRVDPAGRPAARALRLGRRAAARRRRDRPPPGRYPPDGLRRARRRGRGRPRVPPARAPGPDRERHVPGRGVGDRHRERHHGGGAGARHDHHLQRGLRAARAGSLPPAECDGRRHQRHRVEHADDPGRADAAAGAGIGSAPITSRWRRSSAWPP